MSNLDQCPSSKGKEEIPTKAPEMGRLSGRAYWRSLDEYSGTPEFKEFVEREFPVDASVMSEPSRRSFVKIMGAGLALAGAATVPGCRRPDRKIIPYAKQQPEIVPGKPLYFTTAMPLPGGGCEGLLIETHTGRPTKVEGNPLHPGNQGKSSALAQASILGLYDPERLKYPVYNNPARGKLDATWEDFDLWAGEHFLQFDSNGGEGLAFIIDKQSSPTRERLIAAVRNRFPRARFVFWHPAESRASIDGSAQAFGSPQQISYDFAGARCVVSVGSDFMAAGPGAVRNARTFSSTRTVIEGGDEMSRLYAVEAKPTSVGSLADHRFRVSPSQMHNFTIALARAVFALTGTSAAGLANASVDGVTQHDIDEIAKDLVAHRGQSVVVPGDQVGTEAWSLCMAINNAIGAMGGMVKASPMSESLASDSAADLGALTRDINSGRIDTLVTIACNPVYDAPSSMGFAEAFAKVPNTVTFDTSITETEHVSTWSLNGTHYLEQWGDVVDIDGTYSVIQPMIAPLYDPARSDIEFLSMLAGQAGKHGLDLVKETWAGMGNSGDRAWDRTLHNGFVGSGSGQSASVRMGGVLQAVNASGARPAPGQESMDVLFYTSNMNHGQYANNGWLQESPEFGTSVVWDNPIVVSPLTAKKLGLLPEHSWQDEYNPYTKQQMPQAQLVTITLDGREMEAALWILPGMADNTVGIKLGYGREIVGKVGFKVGHNTYAIKPASGALATRGARIKKAAGTYTIASTQNHWSLESRTSIVRAMDKYWWDKYADKRVEFKDEIYGRDYENLNIAEKLGELSHSPPIISIYENPQNRSHRDPDVDDLEMNEALNEMTPPQFAQGPQWGMSIDLNSCMGCNACTIACQSENNIPIVGKNEVAKGREMTWIRMDRYFVGDDLNNPDEIIVQPVACVHCENAPCETVCPVNATVHGDEGTNDMAYNRCIGTRYCANNCPYKVRRFNFFDYAPVKINGGLDPQYASKEIAREFEETVAQDRTFNQNFIPPRLRKKLDEISKMHMNPDVTVRSRGVMEKCTYCIQRIHQARQEVKIKGIWKEKDQVGPIPDGFFQVACQQACPSDAISFGDILDPTSRVSKERESGRSYLLLGYLGTRPRTTYMMRVRNPNEAIRHREHDPLDHGGHHGDDSHGGGHGDDHNGHDDHGGESHSSSYIDRTKRFMDQGYSMSLKVLSGVHA
ncbi:MAG: TAT-variant-translocated molybdopterin oxidoreductase [Phycisphaerales bacterium]